MSLKDLISPPLEAGTSVLDGHQLPPALTPALEYTSGRLARKSLHITCVVARREYELPSPTLSSPSASALSSPASPVVPEPTSFRSTPIRSSFSSKPRLALKNIARLHLSQPDSKAAQDRSSLDSRFHSHGAASPAFSETSLQSGLTALTDSSASTADTTFTSTRARWGLDPISPSIPMTPATPFTTSSSVTGATDLGSPFSGTSPQMPRQPGLRLLHAAPLSPREDRSLRHSLEKAAKKFKIGYVVRLFALAGARPVANFSRRPEWLPNPTAPSFCGLTADLMERSRLQNEVLFASDGLTLLAMDRLYTFKCALATYAKTQSAYVLEDAVDELRRLVLGNSMRSLRKSVLADNYAWLGPVDESALQEVRRMYHRAYGTSEGDSGIKDDTDMPSWPLPDAHLSAHAQTVDDFADDSVVRVSPEAWLDSPLPLPIHGKQLPIEPVLNEGLGRPLMPPPETPKPMSLFYSETARSTDGLSRRKTPPPSLHFQLPVQPTAPLEPGAATPRSTEAVYPGTPRSAITSITNRSDVSERTGTPILNAWSDGGNEGGPSSPDVELDMDAIEDWYREVDIGLNKVAFRPLRAAGSLTDLPAQPEHIRHVGACGRAPEPPLGVQAAKAAILGLKLDTAVAYPRARRIPPQQAARIGAEVAESHNLSAPALNKDASTSSPNRRVQFQYLDGEEDEELTARPRESPHPATDGLFGFQRWNNTSIDAVLSPIEAASPVDGSHGSGPMTPNGYDDISPVTRGEWGHLLDGEWNKRRTVNITMCL